MKLKRTIGTGKIFLYSCGAVIALAGIIWLIINGVYAVYISGEKPGKWVKTHESADIVTPWLLMASAMAIYYRYWKMCSANNVSCTKQTGVFSLLAMVISPVFAAADLLAAKLVFERFYGGIVVTHFEDDNRFFLQLISDYVLSLDENVTELSSPYNMKTMLLLFALMAVYYYCFFIAGYYIMQCFRYGRKKTLIYYAVTIIYCIVFVHYEGKFEKLLGDTALAYALVFIAMMLIIAIFLTNPIVFLYALPVITDGDFDLIIVVFIMMTVFIFITIPNIEALGLKQFPNIRKIKKFLKKYNAQIIAQIIAESEEKINDR